LETLKLSTVSACETNFGCLVDNHDYLVASAFGASINAIKSHLSAYSRRTVRDLPVSGSHWSTEEMIRLFNGDRVLRTIRFRNSFTSNFQNTVYSWLGKIPRGKVTTYGRISHKIGSAPRAVGRAVASNPWPLFVECHRVINANLTVGNYGLCGSLTEAGSATKRTLLLREGVPINEDRIENVSLWDPSG
jgi:methylated-DNA-[protein]-cysteine S-methyltransferase